MLGSGSSSTSTSVADFVQFVGFNPAGTTHLWPDQFTGYSISAWKRSIDRPIPTDKCISLITAIFSNRFVVEVVKRLYGEDAQAFVDVTDEVLPHFPIQGKWPADLTSWRVDVGKPKTTDEEEVFERAVQDMWPLRFASGLISNSTLFCSLKASLGCCCVFMARR